MGPMRTCGYLALPLGAVLGLLSAPVAADWSNWENLGGDFTSDPTVASWGENRLDVFAQYEHKALLFFTKYSLRHKWWNGSSWSDWESLGGTLTSGPTVASTGVRRLSVFYRSSDNALWQKNFNGTSWEAPKKIGGILTSDPDCVSWGPSRIDCFVVGNDKALWHIWWDGNSWSQWESLGGILTSGPTAASWGENRLDVFARGLDSALWHKWWNGFSWSNWESRGGALRASAPFTAGPDCVSWGPNRIDCFVRGNDEAIWHKSWTGEWPSSQPPRPPIPPVLPPIMLPCVWPTISHASPADGATGVPLTATLQLSTTSPGVINPLCSHDITQWQIATDAQFNNIIYDSGNAGAPNLTSITLPSGTLGFNTQYYWRVRFKSQSGEMNSDWSPATSFTTLPAPQQPPPPPVGTAFYDVLSLTLPSTAQVGAQFSGEASIQNTGDAAGTASVQIVVNGTVQDSVNLHFNTGQTLMLPLTLRFNNPGTYTIEIRTQHDSLSKTVNVQGTGTPPGAVTLKSFDTNNNDLIDDPEFFTIIDAWIAGQIGDPTFFKAVDLWVSQSPISTAGLRAKPLHLGMVTLAATSGRSMTFAVHGQGITAMAVEIFDLSGTRIFHQESAGMQLTWNLHTSEGQFVSNGIYLYVVTVRGSDGRALSSDVKKLVILR